MRRVETSAAVHEVEDSVLAEDGVVAVLSEDLILAAAKIRNVTRCRNTMGQPGVLGIRTQPNHPADDIGGILLAAFEGEEIGRFIEQDETDVVYFVDFLLAPQHQAKAIGPAITRALMEEWAARGRGTRVEVMINNEPCLKMCRKLGFTEGKPDERAYVELRWYPSHLAPARKNNPA